VLSADCTRLRGPSNALASAMIETGILYSPSAISRTEKMWWYRNLISYSYLISLNSGLWMNLLKKLGVIDG
jgi:hypothetical protein